MLSPDGFSAMGPEDLEGLRRRAVEILPSSLEHSPLVERAVDQAVRRSRTGFRPPGDLLRDQVDIELAALVSAVKHMSLKMVKKNKGFARIVDDVPTEVFLSLNSTSSAYDPGRGSFYAWLRGMTYLASVRLLTNELTAVHRLTSAVDPAVIPDPGSAPGEERQSLPPLDEILALFKEHLPDPIDHQILVLKFKNQLSSERVAAQLDLNVNTVYKRFERIKKKLSPLGIRFFDWQLR
jgi:DNA-directed RNA polymerase specialized sigma24 family protein